MSELTDKEILNELGVEVESQPPSSRSPKEERIISGFEDIQRYYEKHNRLPIYSRESDIFEKIYAIRLKNLIDNQYKNILEPLDSQNIFSKMDPFPEDELLDIPNDEELLNELGIDIAEKGIRELKFVRSSEERNIAEEIAKREPCLNFNTYKPLFENLQIEIKQGIRSLIPITKSPEIKKGNFYILGGQKAYIADVGKTFMQEYGISDARLLVIFDNGTKSGLLMRSFQKALNIDEHSRMISNPELGPLFGTSKEIHDQPTGKIYILRSESNLPIIKNNRNLIHKIGVTGDTIKNRIRNARQDPTFLMSEVKLVGSYDLFNLSRHKFENLVQKIFSPAKLNIEIKDRFGKPYHPQEWFLVPLSEIEIAIEKISDKSIKDYIYDPQKGKLVRLDH